MPDNPWPADTVERRPLKSLLPYARNARTHSSEQVQQIAASIRHFGFTNPVLVDESGTLIAGHGRVLAAQTLGITKVPTMVAAGWSAAQIKAYRLADNQLALNAGWDDEALSLELGELRDVGFDLGLTGFGKDAVDQLFAPDFDPEAEWQGMPEFVQPDAMAFHTVAVHFKDQEAVDAFARLIGQMITAKTKFTWFPRVERVRSADKPKYGSDESEVSDLHYLEG